MVNESYIFNAPTHQTTCIVFSSPHSGRNYSESFLKNSLLETPQIRTSEDAYVDDLFSCVTNFGASLLAAVAPRAYVDLNRHSDELDSAAISGINRGLTNARILSGLGVIPRVVAKGSIIQSGKMSMEQAQERLDTVYYPYHQKLKKVINQTYLIFGKSVLIDCHSMPCKATTHIVVGEGLGPDVILGDRFGASCSKNITDQLENAFTNQGFTVSRNIPFSGAYILQNYGCPSLNQHAIQIEINRSLYMIEETVEKSENYHSIRNRLQKVVEEIVLIGK